MTTEEKKSIMVEFPELTENHWIFQPARNLTYEQAKNIAELRRTAFPKTVKK